MGNLKFGTNDPSALYYGLSGGNKAYYGGDLVWEIKSNNYLTFEILSGGTVQLSGNCISAQTVEYRVNNGSWNTMTVCGATASDAITVDAGDVVEWRGNNDVYFAKSTSLSNFKGTSYFNVKGPILSLFYGDNAADYDVFPSSTNSNCKYLFQSTKVVSAGELILPNTVVNSCYDGMFFYCTSLTTAPALPATTLASNCYNSMFRSCTSLTTAPALPATTLLNGCYRSMFQGCTSLTTAPALPATTMVNNCYQDMFNGCASLNNVKCLATDISASNCLRNWLSGVSTSGTFTQKTGVTYPSGTSGIPEGWTVIED